MKAILTLTFFMISLTFFSQEKYEYLGAVKLNGNAKTVISYRLVFTEKSGKLTGYSVTDLGGAHETKNKVSGTYNAKTKEITFREEDILYTKSPVSNDMFCFINFTGKVKLVTEKSLMEGSFKGLYKNNTKCIDGTLTLIGSAALYKILGKVNKKLQKSNKVDAAVKQKANPITLLDSLKVNNIIKGQNLNVFTSSAQVNLEIWDNGKEDGDLIDVYQDNVLILSGYKVTIAKKIIPVSIKSTTVFKIVAVNEGILPPNTAMLKVVDNEHVFEVVSSLKKGEETFITIIKKNE
ncbi:hypothetical protein ACLI09_04225 [Flavobacterium sp. RHBU_24]|uniref:hypothetical protein n=1 Tax=Flavobacterium sp. RHBU_24 TaxID=3391185 RepID=UPI003984EA5C